MRRRGVTWCGGHSDSIPSRCISMVHLLRSPSALRCLDDHSAGWPPSGIRGRLRLRGTPRFRLRLRLRLGGGVVGSVLVSTPGSIHSTFIELQLLIIPQRQIHNPPRPLLFRRYNPTKKELKGRKAMWPRQGGAVGGSVLGIGVGLGVGLGLGLGLGLSLG